MEPVLELVREELDGEEAEPEGRHCDAGERERRERVVAHRPRMSRRAHTDRDGEHDRHEDRPERELRGVAERVADERLHRLVGALARAPVPRDEATHLVAVLDHERPVEAEMLADASHAVRVTSGAAADARRIGPELAHEEEDQDRGEQEHRYRSQRAATEVFPHESPRIVAATPAPTADSRHFRNHWSRLEKGPSTVLSCSGPPILFASYTNTVGSWNSGIDTASSASAFCPCFTLPTRCVASNCVSASAHG